MKKISLLVFVIFASAVAFAGFHERPKWVESQPQSPKEANHFFSWGMGTGIDAEQATNRAWANALKRSAHRLGVVGITQQDIDAVAEKGIDEVVSFNRVKRDVLCVTDAISQNDEKVQVYILIIVQRNANGKDDFSDAKYGGCDLDFNKKVAKYNKDFEEKRKKKNEAADKKQEEKEKETEKKQDKKEKETERYKQKQRNRERTKEFWDKLLQNDSYAAWSILNLGLYPVTVGTSLSGRYGGVFGIGYYVDIGVDLGGNPTYNVNEPVYKPAHNNFDIGDMKYITPFHYAVGVKIFPYKRFFLSAGYGTLGCKKTSGFNDSGGHWGMEGWRQGEGLRVMGGYDVLRENLHTRNLYPSIGFGMSYDLFMEKWQPLFNLKLGIAWKL